MFASKNSSGLSVFSDPDLQQTVLTAGNGDIILEPEQAATNVYFIRRGQIRLYTLGPAGASRLISILGVGDWFGSAAIAGHKHYGIRAVAVSETVLNEIPVEKLMFALSTRPADSLQLCRELAARLDCATQEASRLVFEDCNSRLISALIRFSESAASTRRDDGVVLRMTHDQLAQAVGVARETVSLALTQLRQQNLLRTGRNQLMFNPNVLRQATDLQQPVCEAHLQPSA